jgi:DNA-binding response OmpR family regulator
MKILIIDDDVEMVEFVKSSLVNNSYSVDAVYNGEDGSFMARTNAYDIVIIDYTLPDKNGLMVCKDIRASESNAAIIFLSMNYTIKNKVDCLEAGADDYMTKPYALQELYARLEAITRRPKEIKNNNILEIEDIKLDTVNHMVTRDGKSIHLTSKEYGILEYLLRNKSIVISRGLIMEHVWTADGDPFSNTVESHIGNLRRKLNEGGKPNVIHNMSGRGYIVDTIENLAKL